MSEFGAQVDAILAKGASSWTADEHKVIASLIAQGKRSALKHVMETIRPVDLKTPQEVVS